MTRPPAQPHIYHITHEDNLPSIVEVGALMSDAQMIARGGPAAAIGMSAIKRRRLELPVKCHPGDMVGQYVPFYFCPRSIMLFLLYRGNHPDLTYQGGQNSILHLEADLQAVATWAAAQRRRWAFSLSNAGARYAEFRADINQLDELDWPAIAAGDFRDSRVKESKQAEFLVRDSIPCDLIRRIGVNSEAMQLRVTRALAGNPWKPVVEVRKKTGTFRGEIMTRFAQGDILKAEAEALVNTVNCVGIMGRGVALQFKNVFPDNFKAYAAACKRGEVVPGKMFVYETGELGSPRYIINFPTKRHWKGKSRIEDIQSGLSALTTEIRVRKIRSIAIPPLGSGLGGLDWSVVRPMIESSFASLPDVQVMVFEPSGVPTDLRPNLSTNVPKMTPGRASLVALMDGYLGALMDPSISLLEVHKLMFFMQEAGEPLRLNYVKAAYGPYAENLRHVLHAVEGHLVAGYADGGDAPGKQLALVPGASEDADSFLKDHMTTRKRLDRVSHLVEGFETPFGLELLSTVYWIVARDNVKEPASVVEATYQWNERKRQFSREQIVLALDRLHEQRWVA